MHFFCADLLKDRRIRSFRLIQLLDYILVFEPIDVKLFEIWIPTAMADYWWAETVNLVSILGEKINNSINNKLQRLFWHLTLAQCAKLSIWHLSCDQGKSQWNYRDKKKTSHKQTITSKKEQKIRLKYSFVGLSSSHSKYKWQILTQFSEHFVILFCVVLMNISRSEF